ncbi:MAG: hypothetical protein HOQ24_05820 [Mycobacteriaceae bacterium]|nr:hypothetical protein [Mycobacteriaceae bacterium]
MAASATPDPPQDTGDPDQVERDPAAISAAEQLDEDVLATDPLEEGMDPPEQWAEADRFGVTPNEQRSAATLDRRLPQEEPETWPDDQRPVEIPDEYERTEDPLDRDEN